VLGKEAFEDWNDTTNSYIAIGYKAGKEDVTDGDADVIAMGTQAASVIPVKPECYGLDGRYGNTGLYVNAFGREAGSVNHGSSVNAWD
jgi:hypothetical protein